MWKASCFQPSSLCRRQGLLSPLFGGAGDAFAALDVQTEGRIHWRVEAAVRRPTSDALHVPTHAFRWIGKGDKIAADEAATDAIRGILNLIDMSATCTIGEGIKDEHREEIFKPLFTTRKEGRGIGLGLCVVREAVENSGGYINLESTPGEGSTFTVLFPVSPKRKI